MIFQGSNINSSAPSAWDRDPSSTRRLPSDPTCGSSNPSGGISLSIITAAAVTYTISRPATTSPRIRLAVPAATPTTPTRPHRRLPVHTSGLPAAPPLIRIATSAVPNMAVSFDPPCMSLGVSSYPLSFICFVHAHARARARAERSQHSFRITSRRARGDSTLAVREQSLEKGDQRRFALVCTAEKIYAMFA